MISVEQQSGVKQAAEQLFGQLPDWVTFYREIFGMRGVVRQVFPSREELAEFEQTQAYNELQKLLAQLRQQAPAPLEDEEPTRVITVRLPKSLHEALRSEAYDHQTSMNKLCISKLLQFIDRDKVPSET